jgi:hypothetical protein
VRGPHHLFGDAVHAKGGSSLAKAQGCERRNTMKIERGIPIPSVHNESKWSDEAYTFLHLAIHEKSGDEREGILLDGLLSLKEAIDLLEKEKYDDKH